MADTVGIREFARRIGMSPSWVVQRCQANEIPKNEEGKIPLKEGLEAFDKICEEKQMRRAKAPPLPEAMMSFDDARAKKETYLAEIKEMEARVMRGEFVSVAEVEDDARATAEKLRAFCLSAPTRYAGLLENRTQREAEGVLEDVFNELLERIHGNRFTGDLDGDF